MLTGLELMFMGVTRSNSDLFRSPGFAVSPVGKREKEGGRGRGKKKKGRREKGNRKGKEGRRNKDRSEEDKKDF